MVEPQGTSSIDNAWDGWMWLKMLNKLKKVTRSQKSQEDDYLLEYNIK